MKPLSRRDFLKVGGLAVLGTAGATTLTRNEHQPCHRSSGRRCIHLMSCSKAIMAICPALLERWTMKPMDSTQPTS